MKYKLRLPTRWNKAWLGRLVLTPLSTVLVPLTGDTTPRLTRHDFIQQTLPVMQEERTYQQTRIDKTE